MARWLSILLFLVATAWPAAAQDILFVGERQLGALGHFGEDRGPSPEWLQYPRFGGERFVHLPRAGVLDLATGATLPIGEGYPVAYDRARPHVFLMRENGVWQEDVTTNWSVLILPMSVAGLAGCIHATSADVLLCAMARPDGQHDIVRATPFGPERVITTRFADAPPTWVVSPDGSRLYVAHCSAVWGTTPPYFCTRRDVVMVDLVTGATATTESESGLGLSLGLVWDEALDRLFVVGPRVEVYSRDLAPIGAAATGGRCRQLAISPHTQRIYLNTYDYYYGWTSSTLSAWDAVSYRLLEPGRVRSAFPACGPVTVLTAPGAPRHVAAAVRGRNVDLSWTNIGAASHFVLDVGLAPGRTDFSVNVGSEPRASFANVPPGRYYLRVRGGNLIGGGRPSHEAIVEVR